MQRLLPASVVMLAVTVIGAVAVEARENLKGDYAFTSVQLCTVALNPFSIDSSGAPSIIPAGGVFRQHAINTGIQTFNGDGTGSSVGRSHTMNISATGGSISSFGDFTSPFTYTVNDGTVDISFGLTLFRTFAGGGTGNTGTITGTSRQLRIGNGGQTLVGGENGIEQETVVVNIVNDGTITEYRLCTRSNTLVRQ